MIEINLTAQSILVNACVFWCVHNLAIKVLNTTIIVIEVFVKAFFNKKIQVKKIIPTFLYCGKCCSFWAIIILNQNIYQAALIAVMVYFIDLVSEFLKSKTDVRL